MAEEHEREDFVHANASTYRWEQGVDSYLYEASEKPLHRMCNWTNQIAFFDQPMKSDQSDSFIRHIKPEFSV